MNRRIFCIYARKTGIKKAGVLTLTNKNASTSTLLRKLFKTSNIAGFVKNFGERAKYVPFKKYINDLCVDRDTVPERIIKQSGIERTYGHQIFNGIRKPSRDKVIQLAFGFELNYFEAQELLKVARHSALYPKVERDAVIIYALNKGYSVDDTQETLRELSLPLLGREERHE